MMQKYAAHRLGSHFPTHSTHISITSSANYHFLLIRLAENKNLTTVETMKHSSIPMRKSACGWVFEHLGAIYFELSFLLKPCSKAFQGSGYNCLGWCIKHCQSRVDIMAFYTLNNWERDLLHLDRDSRCRIERDIYSCETDWEWQWRLPSLIFYWYLLQMPCHALSFLISHFLPPFSGGESCRGIGIYIYLQTLSVLGERGGSTTNP